MTRVVTGMAHLSAPIALQICGEAFPHACSRSKLIGRAPLLPLATGRLKLCKPFGNIDQRNQRLASSTPRVHITRSMVSSKNLKPQSKDGGSAWLGSSAVLALGGALPGLLLAWKWEQVGASDDTPSWLSRCF